MKQTSLRLPVDLNFSTILLSRMGQLQLLMLEIVLLAGLLLPWAWLGHAKFGDLWTVSFWSSWVSNTVTNVHPGTFGLISIAALGLALLYWQIAVGARVRLGAVGIEAEVPRICSLFGLHQSHGAWRVGWSEIRRVRRVRLGPRQSLGASRFPSAQRLVLETPKGEYWLAPYLWHASEYDHRLSLVQLLRVGKTDADELLASTPLVKAIAQHDIEIIDGSEAPGLRTGFDLTSHKGLGIMVVGLFALGGYAALDQFFFGLFKPLQPLPQWPFLAALGLGLAAAVPLGNGAPWPERIAVTLLALMALMAAVWPGLLRYNRLTSDTGIYVYTAEQPGLFQPPDPGMPPIDLRRADLVDYFEQYPPGTEHPFVLYRGAVDVWQLDMHDLFQRTRQFYRIHDARQR